MKKKRKLKTVSPISLATGMLVIVIIVVSCVRRTEWWPCASSLSDLMSELQNCRLVSCLDFCRQHWTSYGGGLRLWFWSMCVSRSPRQ